MRNRKETGRAKEQEKPTEPATTGHTKEAENDKKDETSTSSSSSSGQCTGFTELRFVQRRKQS